MSETVKPKRTRPSKANVPNPQELELLTLLNYSAKKFAEEYGKAQKDYVLHARQTLEQLLNTGDMSPKEFKGVLDDRVKFDGILFAAETRYKAREDQIIQERLAKLERNTHWKMAAAVSLGTGVVIGSVFAVAGPFFTAWLQPTADELFKRTPTTEQNSTALQPLTVENTTTNNVYNFYASKALPVPTQLPITVKADNNPRGTLTCKNIKTDAYKTSLLELLQSGDIVTMAMNGKKVSMCYRPNIPHLTQHQALSQK
jgi:hypothetical protein